MSEESARATRSGPEAVAIQTMPKHEKYPKISLSCGLKLSKNGKNKFYVGYVYTP